MANKAFGGIGFIGSSQNFDLQLLFLNLRHFNAHVKLGIICESRRLCFAWKWLYGLEYFIIRRAFTLSEREKDQRTGNRD